MMQAVSLNNTSFTNRVDLCNAYKGLRKEELNKAAGVTDAEFIHATGFIGGVWSMESALKIVEASLLEHKLKEEQESKKE